MALPNSLLTNLPNARGTPGESTSNFDRPHEMNRYMGGHRRLNHPYVNGYWYCIIEPPHALFSKNGSITDQKTGDDGRSESNSNMSDAVFEATRWLHSTAESFTPPTRSLNKTDLPGMGGMGSSFVTGQQLTRTFSVTFREYQDTPIYNTIYSWTSILDPHYGISPLNGDTYIPANYKGSAWVFLCKPTAYSNEIIATTDVEQFFYFEGVFPEQAPLDSFNSDINTNDFITLNISFSFDGWPYGKENIDIFNYGLYRLNNVYKFNFESEKFHSGVQPFQFNTRIGTAHQ